MRDLLHFVAAVVLVTLGLGLVAVLVLQDDANRFATGKLLKTARAVAWMHQQEILLDDPPDDLAQSFVTAANEQLSEVDEIFILKGTKYLAHSNPDLRDERLSRDSLADKALYDAGREMKADVEKNLEDARRRKTSTSSRIRRPSCASPKMAATSCARLRRSTAPMKRWCR
ncbi:MAG: hypothetical protein HC923_07640 [Myxococcales bacterium]|nr:hypothetical protein [Myxococcales bacterium]